MSRGKRDSEWVSLRRCLAMIRRAQRGPTSRVDLMAAVADQVPGAYEGAAESARIKRFRHDLTNLRTRLGLDLKYKPAEQAYRLIPSEETPLLDLPAEDLTTLAWLQKTFDELSPQHEPIQTLLDRLIAWLPPERREAIERQRLDLQLDLARRDDNHIPAEVKSGLARALSRRVRVEFDYLAPGNDTGQPRRHTVDPYAYFFHDGHYYLKGYCHTVHGEDWQLSPGAYNAYRLDRMTGLTVEGTKLPPTPPRAKLYKVVYRLDPQLARGGISRQRWIDFTEADDIEYHQDGSVTVNGVTDHLFFAVQALMRYRHHCRILGGPEILGKMRETVRKMAEIYGVG